MDVWRSRQGVPRQSDPSYCRRSGIKEVHGKISFHAMLLEYSDQKANIDYCVKCKVCVLVNFFFKGPKSQTPHTIDYWVGRL